MSSEFRALIPEPKSTCAFKLSPALFCEFVIGTPSTIYKGWLFPKEDAPRIITFCVDPGPGAEDTSKPATLPDKADIGFTVFA